MNPLKAIGRLLGLVGVLLEKAFHLAKTSGLDDKLIALALPYVKEAASRFADNAARREWVVEALVQRKIPEGIARIAVELAYKLYKAEIAKL